MNVVSKRDFVEIEYTGKLKDDNLIFNTIDEKVAIEINLECKDLCPVIVSAGE